MRFENALENKMTKVEEAFEALQKKYGSSKPEQLQAWANMIQIQKHTSLEEAPPGTRKQQHRLNLTIEK